ncbi:Allantoicase [Athelia psychrophila]|uniref:Allantoicase n=1 Tax=Athelia psychrophila TaxID=1759441 RepID=A0A166WXT4_9AGAM|nr:Allantoicase [Fibularhizoctonia sp. CBS 109695]
MAFERIPLEQFSDNFLGAVELSSVALGGKIISLSDEFFAEASHLIQVEAAPSLKGQFGPKGALYSGWETRRHNPTYDWCIIKLGTAGTVTGFDIDTTHFSGNEGPQASVEGLLSSGGADPQVDDPEWKEILPVVDLGPSARHLFKIPESASVNYVKLKMYPDGGIARFRVYGSVAPIFPQNLADTFDLAHVFAGGRVERVSDQHFGVGANLILPGRGKDMGDGWETKRSRQKGHNDWVIIKLGVPGLLDVAEIDTAHFMGNFPESVELHALHSPEAILSEKDLSSEEWTLILPRTKTGPHRQHFFQLEHAGQTWTHVRVTIYPDGGLKRVRLMGRRAGGTPALAADLEGAGAAETTSSTAAPPQAGKPRRTVPIVPLTPEAFAPFGQVVQAYADDNAAPRGTRITPANQGTASKFHKLSLLSASYPADSKASAGLSVYRCAPLPGGREWRVGVLERHAFTNQAFVPMGGAAAGEAGGGDALADPGSAYLVVVAGTGADGKPDLQTLRAFKASAAQGIVYNTAVWHQPMAVFDKPMDFTCVETQIGDGSKADCEILELEDLEDIFVVVN